MIENYRTSVAHISCSNRNVDHELFYIVRVLSEDDKAFHDWCQADI